MLSVVDNPPAFPSIKSAELNSGEVAIITDIVREQLGVDIDKIIIIPSE